MPIAARDASDRVEQLTLLTTKLAELVESEIEFLRTRRPSEMTERAKERDRLALIYTREMNLIRKERALIADARPSVLSRLKEATAVFRDALSRETTLLVAMKSVSEGILKSVATEADSQARVVTGYSKDAGLRSGRSRRAPSLALNETV